MAKHLPWIVVAVVTAVLIAGLHFFVFAPLKAEYESVNQDMKQSIQTLNQRIESVPWIGEKPDPRKPSFSWNHLLKEVEGTFESRLASYQGLMSRIDISLPVYKEEETIQLILDRIKALQDLESKHANIRILKKWWLDTTNTTGYNGTRPLDLTEGGYRSYSAEERIDGRHGTVQFAVNIAPWYVADPEAPDPAQMTRRVLFHAGKHNPRKEGMPSNVHPGFSSEILIEKTGFDLIATVRGPGGEMVRSANLFPLITKSAAPQQWKVIRFTWGARPQDIQLYVDGQSADVLNQMARGPRPGGGIGGGARPVYGGGAPVYGGGLEEYGGAYGTGLGFPGAGRIGRPAVQEADFTLEPLDSFVIGADLQGKNESYVMFDAVRIWDVIGGSGAPPNVPLFEEDFEQPFGSDKELRRSLTQLIRYHENLFDPVNAQDVKDQYQILYQMQLGSAGLVTPKGTWVDSMRRLAFLDRALKVGAVRHNDLERLALQISLPIPDPEIRRNLVIFLDLTLELVNAMISSQADLVTEVGFLNWSTTVSDEPLKKAFKEAYENLKLDVQSAEAMGPMGMMGGFGMYGAPGMPGMYGGEFGGYGAYPMYGEETYAREDEDPEERKKRLERMKEQQKKAQEEAEKAMKKYLELQSNKEKLERWTTYINRNEVAPDYYEEYRKQSQAEGKDFFVRYTLKTTFYCRKEKLARALYALEFGENLVFLSQISISPTAWDENMLDVFANVEYNFMKGVEEIPGVATIASGTAPPPLGVPSSSAGAGL